MSNPKAAKTEMTDVVLVGAGIMTAVLAMLEIMQRCFADCYQTWQPKLKEMVPSLGTELSNEAALFDELWSWGTTTLGLTVLHA